MLNRDNILYCRQCGKLERYVGHLDDVLNPFRAHLNPEGTDRCLDKGEYTDSHCGAGPVFLYIMESKH